jgi:ribose transport system permease protein
MMDIRKRIQSFNLQKYVVYLSFILILLFFGVTLKDKGFLSGGNIMNVLRQTAMVSVMAIGMTFTITAGDIDLSIGSTVALSALVSALALRSYSVIVAVLAGLAVVLWWGW